MSRPVKDRYFIRETAKIVKAYEGGKSAQCIAQEYGTYTQKIYRVLKKAGVKMRDASEAQLLALEEGRSKHPTKGRLLTEEEKLHLSNKIEDVWKNLTPEQLEDRRLKTKAIYDAKTPEEIAEFRRLSAEGILQASREGSKLEKFLLSKLTEKDYKVVFHKKGFILNDKLEIDLLIPSLKVAIEVDGIYHSEDVFNNGALGKVQNKDDEKNGLLLGAGYVVIRLANTAKTCTGSYMRERANTLLAKLEEIRVAFPPQGQRLIYLGD